MITAWGFQEGGWGVFGGGGQVMGKASQGSIELSVKQ